MRMRYLRDVVTLRLDVEKCIGCGRCQEVCPRRVFVVEEQKSRIVDRDACMECGACARNCPVDALWVKNGVGCAVGMLNTALGLNAACCGENEACSCGDDKEPVKARSAKEKMTMDQKTKELIAVGAHCQPCLEYHVAKAKELGIGEDEVREAIGVGHMVEKGAMSAMKQFSAGVIDAKASTGGSCCPGGASGKKGCCA